MEDIKKQKVIVNFYPRDWNMFSASTNLYNHKSICIFKECIGRIYDPQTKAWLFPNATYSYLINQISKCSDLELGATIAKEYLDKIHNNGRK